MVIESPTALVPPATATALRLSTEENPDDHNGPNVSKSMVRTVVLVLLIFFLFLAALFLFRKTFMLKQIVNFLLCRRRPADNSNSGTATPLMTVNSRTGSTNGSINGRTFPSFGRFIPSRRPSIPPPAYSQRDRLDRSRRFNSSSSSITVV
ncbi:hypothetical protein PQX77_020560 [Marasmius sp. AFHP31]|nr:hypothetical protein PQX77_020560 [Marasmius sp. AFHP31]